MTPKCPRCRSARIKRGYRQTKWWSALIGRYHLLCDSCNWEFVGFVVPGTIKETSRKRVKTSAEIIKFSPLEFTDESVEVVEQRVFNENNHSDEETNFSLADNSDESFSVAAEENSFIDNVLITGDAEINRKQANRRSKRKRRGRVKVKK